MEIIVVYSIKLEQRVIDEDLPSIPMPYKEQIKKAIRERLTVEPVKLGKPLRYSLLGFRRLRVGDWRIIYRINGEVVEIVKIGNRKDIYED
ncbi:MAG: type II toxin-antitoxin system RelE/ParE family toxin [Treponema sp.]|nr:type II toxin-antitoxin system RelE/ParE family toxin [Treponema sp.]